MSSLQQSLDPLATSLGRRFATALGQSLAEQWWLLAIVAVQVGAATIVGLHIHRTAGIVALYLPVYVQNMPVMIVALLVLRLAYIAVALRPARPLLMFAKELRDEIFTVRRIAQAIPALIVIPFFFGASRR